MDKGKVASKKKRGGIEWRYKQLMQWKMALTTLLEMFQTRGYNVDPAFVRNLSHAYFKHIVLSCWEPNIGFVIDIPKPGATGSFTKVCFYRSETVGINDMRTVLERLSPCQHILVVVAEASKPAVRDFIHDHSKELKIEIFTTKELSFNLLRHKLVPQHRLLEAKEVSQLLKRYNLPSIHVFNKILVTDPVARFYGVGIGHVFEITRPTPEGHSFYSWRVVSRAPLK